jgi:capsular exopolysaccharide synthesis family protein
VSRIDEALERARGGTSPFKRDDVFASPWDVRNADSKAMSARPEPAPTGAGSPFLAREAPSVVTLGSEWPERLATGPRADQGLVEQFRRLAGALHNNQTATGVRLLMVTSAAQDDGKTMTSLNLALVLSESYNRRVLLIDADLRNPSLGRTGGTDGSTPGLSDALKAPADQKLAVVQITPTLTLLPAGRPDSDPMSALTSSRMRQILEDASRSFDWVILDSPPMGPVADAHLLLEIVDAVVFVVRAGHTQYLPVKKAVDALGERLLGVVLNGVTERQPAYYGHYGASASHRP